MRVKKEYIDRDEVLKRIKLVVYVDSTEESHGEVSYEEIENIPAAPVELIIFGEWEVSYGTCGFPINRKCSICNKVSTNGKTKYCPHCGANMQKISNA